jgi:drug/metabolite transporter (DMT)-like permease
MIALYLLIVILTVSQSASTKLYNRQSTNSNVFNAIKALTAFAIFALMAIGGFTLHLPTVLFGACYGVCLCISMYAGYKALCLGPMALTSMLVSFSIIIPLIWGLTVGEESLGIVRVIALIILLCAIILTNADKIFGKKEAKGRDDASKQKADMLCGLYSLRLRFCAME